MSRTIKHMSLASLLIGTVLTFESIQAQAIIYVDDDASLGGDGTSWQTAFKYLQDALATATVGDEIRVAQGLHKPDQDEAGNVTLGDREAAFRLISRVVLYGGYRGLAGAGDPDDRDIARFESILSGDLTGNDGPGFADNDENSYHVVSGSGTDETALLDGFTVTSGNANGSFAGREYGGGVYCANGSPSIAHCTIAANSGVSGGGISLDSGSRPRVTDCTVERNVTTGYGFAAYGGGIDCRDASAATFARCVIRRNRSTQGGGIRCSESMATFENCVIAQNEATYDAGGIYARGFNENPTFTNCTITANIAHPPSNNSGGARVTGVPTTFTNCILWANEPTQIFSTRQDARTVTFSDVQDGHRGTGNIDADPLFAFSDDYHLEAASPCRDAGMTSPPGGLSESDLDGNTRRQPPGGRVDMGAYEFDPTRPTIALSPTTVQFFLQEGDPRPGHAVFSVRNAGSGTLNWLIAPASDFPSLKASPSSGSSTGETDDVALTVDPSGLARGTYTCRLTVSDATAVNDPREVMVLVHVANVFPVPTEYATIQDAIDATEVPGDLVLIAGGTYRGIGNRDLDFGGKCVTVRGEHGPDKCIIDCEGAGRGFYFHTRETRESRVEGLTIRNGEAEQGAGIRCEDSSPTIANCILSGNNGYAIGSKTGSPAVIGCVIRDNHGSGIYAYSARGILVTRCSISGNAERGLWGTDDVLMTDCTLTGNRGGGIAINGDNVVISRCAITGNRTSGDGGGIWVVGASHTYPTIRECMISGNEGNYGGGIYCGQETKPTFINCVVTGNQSLRSGGAVFVYNSGSTEASFTRPAFINCSITRNTTTYTCGGICLSSNTRARATITSSILWDNSGSELAGGGYVLVTYSDVQDDEPGDGMVYPGSGNIDVDPLFVDEDGLDDIPGTNDHDLRLAPGSPCINAGDPGFIPEPGAINLDGHARVLCGRVDMGGYEFGVGDFDCNRIVDLTDFSAWPACMTSPFGGPYSQGCEGFDFEFDSDVDLQDYLGFQSVFAGQ